MSLTMQGFQSDYKNFELNSEVSDKERRELERQKEDQGDEKKQREGERQTWQCADKWLSELLASSIKDRS